MCSSPNASLIRLLCLWLTLACCQAVPVTTAQIRSDIKSLSKTMIYRIERERFPMVTTTRIVGLEFIPQPPAEVRMRSLYRTLDLLRQIIHNLVLREQIQQIIPDLENLIDLVRLASSKMGCAIYENPPVTLSLDQRNMVIRHQYVSSALTFSRLVLVLRAINNAQNLQRC